MSTLKKKRPEGRCRTLSHRNLEMTVLNLYTPADGLFGTHVTWTDIEEDMQRELDTEAMFGPEKTVRDIGEGNGFMSKMLLVEPDWQKKDRELPKKFVVKILTQIVLQKFTADAAEQNNIGNKYNDPTFMKFFEELQKRCHNTEVAVYKLLAKIPEGKITLPKIYCSREFSESNQLKGYIIMEYLESIKAVHVFENVTPKEVKQILRNKAVIEAYSIDVAENERAKLFEKPFKDVFGCFFKKEVLNDMASLFRTFEGGKLADKADRLEKIIPDMVDLDWADNLAEEIGMDRVLCHGDLWSTNILWRPNGDELNLAAIIDYQIGHFGCSATDLVRLFCACLSGKDRRAHWEDLVEDFYGYLKEEVGDKRMPYTLEQLKEAYRRYFPMGSAMIVPMIGPLFDAIFKSPDEELRKKYMVTVMEKTASLLDDMFYYHDRNARIKNDNKF